MNNKITRFFFSAQLSVIYLESYRFALVQLKYKFIYLLFKLKYWYISCKFKTLSLGETI